MEMTCRNMALTQKSSVCPDTKGSIGIDVDEKALIVGDALMNMFHPTVSLLYNDEKVMLESAKNITELGERTIYFGHGKPVQNKSWVK